MLPLLLAAIWTLLELELAGCGTPLGEAASPLPASESTPPSEKVCTLKFIEVGS
jgi:hypothetical protein